MRKRQREKKALFLDRDGVINIDTGYTHRVEDLVLLEGIAELIRFFSEEGYLIVVVTNQSGIARGLYSIADMHAFNAEISKRLALRGCFIDGIYFCPHIKNGVVPEFSVPCNCRKPRPGMLLTAAEDLGIDLAESVIVGDRVSDMLAGKAAGLKIGYLIDTNSSDLRNSPSGVDGFCRVVGELSAISIEHQV